VLTTQASLCFTCKLWFCSYESCPIPICGNSYTASLTSTSADETYLSNWLIADGTLSCPSGYLLANCHCANEHCRGAEFQPASSSEPNSVDQCLILFQSSQQQLPVMTRGETNRNGLCIRRTVNTILWGFALEFADFCVWNTLIVEATHPLNASRDSVTCHVISKYNQYTVRSEKSQNPLGQVSRSATFSCLCHVPLLYN